MGRYCALHASDSEILRALAAGDSSVALVSAMHPAVLSFWLATSVAPAPYTDGWTGEGY